MIEQFNIKNYHAWSFSSSCSCWCGSTLSASTTSSWHPSSNALIGVKGCSTSHPQRSAPLSLDWSIGRLRKNSYISLFWLETPASTHPTCHSRPLLPWWWTCQLLTLASWPPQISDSVWFHIESGFRWRIAQSKDWRLSWWTNLLSCSPWSWDPKHCQCSWRATNSPPPAMASGWSPPEYQNRRLRSIRWCRAHCWKRMWKGYSPLKAMSSRSHRRFFRRDQPFPLCQCWRPGNPSEKWGSICCQNIPRGCSEWNRCFSYWRCSWWGAGTFCSSSCRRWCHIPP